MKVGFDAKRAFFNARGLGNYSRNLINGLLTYYSDNDYYLFGKRPGGGECLEWIKKNEGKLTVVTPHSPNAVSKALWRSYYVGNDIEKQKIDIYHGLSHEIPFKKKSPTVKYVVTIHDLIFLRYKENFKWIDIQIYLKKIKYSCKHADLIIAISEQTKQDLINYLNIPAEKIVVHYQSCSSVYYPENEETFCPDIKEIYKLPENYYLFVGALVKHKNIERIIKAMALLPGEIKYPLVVVGKGNAYKKELVELSNKLNMSDKIIFIDYVKNEHMPFLYRRAKLMVWPSLFEGFGIPIIEALFCKLPVVTSNVGCFPEVGGPGVCYVNPDSSDDIANGIKETMLIAGRYEKMQQEGFDFVQKFHVKNTSLQLMDIYSKVLKS